MYLKDAFKHNDEGLLQSEIEKDKSRDEQVESL